MALVMSEPDSAQAGFLKSGIVSAVRFYKLDEYELVKGEYADCTECAFGLQAHCPAIPVPGIGEHSGCLLGAADTHWKRKP
jgi:hypothetical protein